MFDVLPMPFMFGLNALQASPSGAELDLTNTIAGQTCVTQSVTCPLPQGVFAQGLPAAVVSAQTNFPGVFAPSGTGRLPMPDQEESTILSKPTRSILAFRPRVRLAGCSPLLPLPTVVRRSRAPLRPGLFRIQSLIRSLRACCYQPPFFPSQRTTLFR